MIIKSWQVLVLSFVVAKIESHVKEEFFGLWFNFHLGSRKTVNKPIYGVVFTDTVVDKFSFFTSNIWSETKSSTRIVFLEHFDLQIAAVESLWNIMWNTHTSYGELKILSPNKIDPKDSGCFLGPPSGSQKRNFGL